MKKKDLYITLTGICLIFIILLSVPFGQETPPPTEETVSFLGKEAVAGLEKNPLFIFTSFIYAFMFLAGLFNLVLFFIKKIKNKPVFSSSQPSKEFPLGQEKTARLFFWLVLLVLSTYILPGLVFLFKKINPIYLILGANLLLQVGSILLILKEINFSFFGLSIKKNELNFAFSTYTALIPIIIASLFLNLFLMGLFGLKPPPSPVEKITPLITTNTALFIFALQTIIIGPLAEEFVFRGFLYNLLRKKYSFLISASGLSIFFALLHRSLAGIIALFVISFAICYLYEKTKKISAAFVLHALHNLIIFLFFLAARQV